MANTKRETPITRGYWRDILREQGTLYEEQAIVRRVVGVQQVRRVDGLAVLDHPSGEIRTGQGLLDLNGRKVRVIQTKADPLNAYVFGQALLSPLLIKQTWDPDMLNTTLVCTADHPQMRDIIQRDFPHVEVSIRQGERSGFRLERIPEAARAYAADKGASLRLAETIVPGLRPDGVIVSGASPGDTRPLTQAVVGNRVTTVHSERRKGKSARIGMWIGGDVVMSQRILRKMGAKSVFSVVLCGHRDDAIERALGEFADFETRIVP